jgi:hypothetical protein
MDLSELAQGKVAQANAVSIGCAQSSAKAWYVVVDTLRQLASGPTWDGNMVSKSDRDRLVTAGLIDRHMGWNFLTLKGVEYCITLGILRE